MHISQKSVMVERGKFEINDFCVNLSQAHN